DRDCLDGTVDEVLDHRFSCTRLMRAPRDRELYDCERTADSRTNRVSGYGYRAGARSSDRAPAIRKRWRTTRASARAALAPPVLDVPRRTDGAHVVGRPVLQLAADTGRFCSVVERDLRGVVHEDFLDRRGSLALLGKVDFGLDRVECLVHVGVAEAGRVGAAVIA